MSRFNSFDDFINDSIPDEGIKLAAGVAIIWDNQILLVHPTNSSWQKNTLGIPKGRIEKGEDPLDAAIREVREEIGISIDSSKLYPESFTSPKYNKSGKLESHLIYFLLKIESPFDIGLRNNRVPKSQLQLEEVDWAGFINIEDAYPKINTYQRIILDRLIQQ
jgi:predicted NUDIX family NTP pyrophosphohydrolase